MYKRKGFALFFSQEDNVVFCKAMTSGKKWVFLNILPMINAYLLTSQSEVCVVQYQLATQRKRKDHRWMICVDLKIVNFLLGQQSGYTKYLCYLFLW